ncbi:dihydroorotate dehydrogenase electron transfer subunit [Candidatus Latescibacterota bacterium]
MREFEAGIIRTELRGQSTRSLHALHGSPLRFGSVQACTIDLLCEDIAREAEPGQFVHVRAGSGTDPFLRRTFSVCGTDTERGAIKLLIDIVGRGTELLCSMKRGGSVSVIGPLGTGFDTELGGDGACIIVAGGVGAAPLLFLSERLSNTVKRQVIFMMGARNSAYLRILDGLLGEEITLLTATEDGDSGFHGMVSELLEKNIETVKPAAIYSCGPNAMLKEISGLAERTGIPCQVSLEERMACGIGVCLGCAVPLKGGHMVRSCVDGPVFDASEVVW